MTGIETVHGYHAHIYYRNNDERDTAARLRAVLATYPDVRMGRWREQPVGPHPLPMYQVAFPAAQFPAIVPWLMLNRAELTILVHPETGDDVVDHRDNPLWLGEKLELNIAFLEQNRSE